jgi:uroporphyrinogen-III synthase
MRLLLTRPANQDEPLVDMLLALGHEIVHEPLLRIEALPAGDIEAGRYQAIAVTSSNALRNLKPSPDLAAVPVFAVGAATAKLARGKGFTTVVAGEVGAPELAQALAAKLDPVKGAVLYLRGDDVAFDLAAALAGSGFNVESRKVYRAVPAINLSDAAISGLVDGTIGGVVLLSPRTAQTYVKLLHQAALEPAQVQAVHFCLSARVATPLDDLGIKGTRVAARPDLQELVALIGRDATHSTPSA